MEKREIGKSGLHASVIGFGAWAVGGQLWGHQEDQDSIVAIHRAIELGVNFIDTAPVYGFGRSEEVVGKAIKGQRDKVIIATKCGLKWNENGEVSYDASRQQILKEIEDSLRRLKVDVIDLYQIHWPDPNTSIEVISTTVAELKRQGKIKAIGVSNYTLDQIKETMKYCQLDAIQPPYNMFLRQIERDILPFCRENNIGVVSYGPLYQGFLTGKFFLTGSRPTDPLRAQHSEMREGRYEINRDTVLKLVDIADWHDVSMAQVAINWVLCQPGITVAICGARNPKQVEENVAAVSWRLTSDELHRIDIILNERLQQLESVGEPVQA